MTVYEFSDAVFVAQGEDPTSADKKVLNDVRTVVAAAFVRSRLTVLVMNHTLNILFCAKRIEVETNADYERRSCEVELSSIEQA